MKKSELINYFGHLYLQESMTAEQIAEETGYGLSTVKHYYSNEELDGVRKTNVKSNTDKKKYKVLSKDEMREMFKKEHQLV